MKSKPLKIVHIKRRRSRSDYDQLITVYQDLFEIERILEALTAESVAEVHGSNSQKNS